MNNCKVHGVLRKGDKKYIPGYLYWLDVTRKSGTVDTIMVISPDGNLTEGSVHIDGHVRSEYIKDFGVPTFIVPDNIEEGEADGISETTVTGRIKAKPVCRNTKRDTPVSTILLITDDGTIPVLLWNGNAKMAASVYDAGDLVTASGRMQSREYPDKKGNIRIAYELSAKNICLAEDV